MSHQIFTIGHSNQSLEDFLALLKKHGIAVLVDIRSQPYTKHASHFNAENLKAALIGQEIKYVYMGKELGGRPHGAQCYDSEGYVLYWRLAQSPALLAGIDRVVKGAGQYRIALMCSEENPRECHRHLLVARVLRDRGISVSHIRGDGRVETEEELKAEEQPALPLFAEPDERAWRSVRAIRKGEPWPDTLED